MLEPLSRLNCRSDECFRLHSVQAHALVRYMVSTLEKGLHTLPESVVVFLE